MTSTTRPERSLVRPHRSVALKLSVAGLIGAAVAIVIQIVAGVDYPTVPPGLVILLVAAGIVAFVPSRWTAVVAVIVPAFLLVGGFSSAAFRDALGDPGKFGQFAGSILQLAAMAVALIAGLILGFQALTRRH